jgi:hypothetical protein
VTDEQRPLDEGMAGRLVLVTDVDLPAAVRQACADLAAALASQAGMPVTVAAVPISRLDALEDSLRGPESAPRATAASAADSDGEMLAEMRRGIWETTGLYTESIAPGWLSLTCDSPTMAAWMCAAIILENVGARVDDDRLLLPAGPDYQLKDEVKSIITVVAKTHHYWQAHVADPGRVARDADRG